MNRTLRYNQKSKRKNLFSDDVDQAIISSEMYLWQLILQQKLMEKEKEWLLI